jgi:endonuclease YncB( thermonuclease family)
MSIPVIARGKSHLPVVKDQARRELAYVYFEDEGDGNQRQINSGLRVAK